MIAFWPDGEKKEKQSRPHLGIVEELYIDDDGGTRKATIRYCNSNETKIEAGKLCHKNRTTIRQCEQLIVIPAEKEYNIGNVLEKATILGSELEKRKEYRHIETEVETSSSDETDSEGESEEYIPPVKIDQSERKDRSHLKRGS